MSQPSWKFQEFCSAQCTQMPLWPLCVIPVLSKRKANFLFLDSWQGKGKNTPNQSKTTKTSTTCGFCLHNLDIKRTSLLSKPHFNLRTGDHHKWWAPQKDGSCSFRLFAFFAEHLLNSRKTEQELETQSRFPQSSVSYRSAAVQIPVSTVGKIPKS